MKIRVAVCQVDMEWEHTARNLERLEPIVAAADADIAVLPEMFATGFKLRPARVAEPADGLVASTMRRWAAQYGSAYGSAMKSNAGKQGAGSRSQPAKAHGPATVCPDELPERPDAAGKKQPARQTALH